jgi:hypothetical protein
MMIRQQVLVLHLSNRSLDSETVGWALYDGAKWPDELQVRPGDEDTPSYPSVLAALQDGWKLLQAPAAIVIRGGEHEIFALPFEFILTRDVEVLENV